MAGVNLHQPFHYAQDADPGTVGAGKWWYDTNDNILYIRDSGDSSWVTVADGGAGAPPALTDLTDVVISTPRIGSVLAYDGTDWDDRAVYSHLVGPFYFPDLAGTASNELKLLFYNTTTVGAVNVTRRVQMPLAGYVVGLFLVSDAARLTGTATARVMVGGTPTAFNGGSVVLDGTNTTTDSDIVHPTAGVAFAASNQLAVEVNTSGWTPTTANVTAWLIVQYTPFD
jgi:hypothetical protein